MDYNSDYDWSGTAFSTDDGKLTDIEHRPYRRVMTEEERREYALLDDLLWERQLRRREAEEYRR